MNIYNELNKLDTSKSVCVIGHLDPDADAFSSMVVLREFIKDYYKIETIDLFAECEEVQDIFQDILGNVQINPNPSSYDTAIMLDCPNCERLGIYKNLYESASFKIVIDHHATNNYSGNVNIVEMCSSTCEIVYSILKHFNYNVTPENQGKLYAGMITDTNNFVVGNFGKRTFEIASECVENINPSAIHDQFLATNTKRQMDLLSIAIQNLNSFNNGQILISHINNKEASNNNATFKDFAGIINKLATISGNKMVCLIYPHNDNFYVSLRAKQDYDVSIIAKDNGGGGHKGAAAFLSTNSIEEIEKTVLELFKKQLTTTSNFKKKVF